MSQVCMYDFTLPRNEKFASMLDVYNHVLKGWTKKWVFQLEKGDSGYEHWQGRVSLIKKRRIQELVGKWCVGGHISITSNNSSKEFSYVMKNDTRIDGPFVDTEFSEPPPKTRQLREFEQYQLYPWQEKVLHIAQRWDVRSITLIYDTTGNSGKTSFSEYMEQRGLAYEIPPFRAMEDLMQACMGIPPQKAYIIDMPRGMKKDKLGDFYAGLECLKNGVMYDKRYSFKKRRIDRPQVIVFTNCLPEWSLMSLDRWDVYQMNSNKDIEPYILNLAN